MNVRIFPGALALLAIILLAPPTGAVTYKATILHPAGQLWSHGYGASIGTQIGVGAIPAPGGYYTHALLWNDTAASVVDLNPTALGVKLSTAWDASGSHQVGDGLFGLKNHALVWTGTAESVVDLHPAAGYDQSFARGVAGNTQAGIGYWGGTISVPHALLWHGTADSIVDLNPLGFEWSEAHDTSPSSQVGIGVGPATNFQGHALLWHGTADSFVDLHPDGFTLSRAYGIWGDQQVGVGHIFDPIRLVTHALLWNGTADSFIDLHPAGFERSIAYAVAGNLQVGSANGAATGGMNQARLWHGSADSIVDLHQFVVAANPAFVSSFARAIAADGSIVGEANDGVNPYAILWIPVPEPGSFVIMLYGLAVTLIGSARCRRT